MRSAILAVGLALAFGPAVAGAAPPDAMPSTTDHTGTTPGGALPSGATPDATPTPENSQTATPPAGTALPGGTPSNATTSANPASSAGADTSATAPNSFQVGQAVQDNTGASIGTISNLTTGADGQQMAVIKMGTQSFQVPTDRLGETNGSAEINLTQAQIAAMLHAGH